jgi:hypothetical protein
LFSAQWVEKENTLESVRHPESLGVQKMHRPGLNCGQEDRKSQRWRIHKRADRHKNPPKAKVTPKNLLSKQQKAAWEERARKHGNLPDGTSP